MAQWIADNEIPYDQIDADAQIGGLPAVHLRSDAGPGWYASDEVKVVAQAFDEMAAALEKAETLRGNLLADVAHQLRMPLSVIQGSLRAILDDVYKLDMTEIARLYDQTRHLSRPVDGLRELAQAGANQLPHHMTTVDLTTLIQETAAIYAPIVEAEGLALRLELEDNVPTVHGDRARLAHCLQNLLNKGIHHTPRGGEIIVELICETEHIRLRVRDTRQGIATEHLTHNFDRFYRADSARSRDTGGIGLGPAIARAIVQPHGREVTVASGGSGRGSIFTVQLSLPAENTHSTGNRTGALLWCLVMWWRREP